MTELLDVTRLRQIDVNPFTEEGRQRVPVLHWIIDELTQRPVAHWRLEERQHPRHGALNGR